MEPEERDLAPSTSGRVMLYAIACLSGIAGLGYQIVWTRMFAVGLGHEMPAVLAVVSAFFGGLSLGAWLLDRRLATARRPDRWYVVLEVIIGGWALATAVLIPFANEWAFTWIGTAPSFMRHWSIAFLLPFVFLLPATTAMGATLPAMDRFAADLMPDRRIVGGLYAANTLGAVIGTLVSAFVIIPLIGFSKTLFLLAGLNLLCAIAVALVFNRATTPDEVEPERDTRLVGADLHQAAFFTGLFGIGYEVLGVRVLSNVLENTVYSFAAALSVFLAGTAIGGALYQRFLRHRSADRTLGVLLLLTTTCCIIGTLAMSYAQRGYVELRSLIGPITAEATVAAAVFGLPSLVMGATFSHLAQQARHARGGVGTILATNTLGGALAPFVFGVLLLPEIGAKWTLLTVSLGYLSLIPSGARPTKLLLAASFVVLLMVPLNLQSVVLRRGAVLLHEVPGVMASVAVTQDEQGDRDLRVNNRYEMGGTGQPLFERSQAALPLLLHRDPRDVLFLGVGTGITIGGATIDPDVRSTGVELVPEVVEVLPFFEPNNEMASRNERIDVQVADARRFIRATQKRYDVIVADLFQPARDGAGWLYTVEHFAAIRDALADDGVACVWLPTYQMDSSVFKTIVRSYLHVFPEAGAIVSTFDVRLPAIGLINRAPAMTSPADWYARRGVDGDFHEALDALLLKGEVQFFGRYLANATHLQAYAGTGPLNLDDHPVVMFQAPDYVYRRYPEPWTRLLELTDVADAASLRWAALDSLDSFAERMDAYWQARRSFLRGEVLGRTGQVDEGVDALLESVRRSRDFELGVGRCLQIAKRYAARRQTEKARSILTRLVQARPERSEARSMLKTLSP